MARQKRVIGDVLKVDLGDGTHTYARVLPEASYAFYDVRTSGDITSAEITKSQILFIVAVMKYAVTTARWRRVGNVPLEPSLQVLPPKFIQDEIDPSQFRLYRDGKMVPATRQQCEGLEAAAVWDPAHVEDRLRDHFQGKPNRWVESLKIKG